MCAKIMVVDDVPYNLKLLTTMLQKQGYESCAFPKGMMALMSALEDPPDLVLLDINMPEMNGYEVCERFKSVDTLAEIPIIFISANTETIDKVRAFTCGGVDYVTKPFQFEEIHARIKTHLELRRVKFELQQHNLNLQKLVTEQVASIIAAKEEISDAHMATIVAMSKIAEAKDNITGKHIERTQLYCRLLAQKLQEYPEFAPLINDTFIDNLYHASPLHDIGKVAIPDSILRKPGKLTFDEFEIMKTHVLIGYTNLEAVYKRYPNNTFIKMGMEIARSHHEKWDGSGYPDGLSGDAIPLAGQIMAVADVYDALRTERSYKSAFSHEKSCDIMMAGIGTHFSPTIGKAFQELQEEFAAINARMLNK